MKKALIASTALVLSAGVAAADVTISGLGRTGVIYYENQTRTVDGEDLGVADTQIASRLRFNIDASTSTDQGVEFGGRVRMQWDQGNSSRGEAASLNAGMLYVTASGFTVEVGNVGNAYDSLSVLFAHELGAFDRTVGARNGRIFAYESSPYANRDRSGVAVRYALGDATIRASYIDPDQSGLGETGAGSEEEFSLSAEYKWNDVLEVEGAYTMNGQGIDDNEIFYLGGRYAVAENARVGLTYVNASNDTTADVGNTFVLFGDYTLADGMTNLEAYISDNNADGNETDNAFGVGVNYDLGGARLGASIHRDYSENVTADFGVRFNF